MLFFGDSSGRIYMTDELLNPLGMFQAYSGDVCCLKVAAATTRRTSPL